MVSASLNEIIDDLETSNGSNLKQTVLTIDVNTVRTFTPSEIKTIRLENNRTQNLLAKFLCVSKKQLKPGNLERINPMVHPADSWTCCPKKQLHHCAHK